MRFCSLTAHIFSVKKNVSGDLQIRWLEIQFPFPELNLLFFFFFNLCPLLWQLLDCFYFLSNDIHWISRWSFLKKLMIDNQSIKFLIGNILFLLLEHYLHKWDCEKVTRIQFVMDEKYKKIYWIMEKFTITEAPSKLL